MADPILDKLLQSIESRQAVALVTVVNAGGDYRAALGQKMLVWLKQPPHGALELGDLKATVLSDARQTLAVRKSQVLAYKQPNGTVSIFVEVQRRPPTLFIVGAGHVALPLAQLGKLVDFDVVVLDDRPRFANKQRFPMADQVLAQPFRTALSNWPINNDTFFVLVTRGHSHDVDCLLEVIDSPARYIGMIGSKRRVKAVFDLLEQEQGINRAGFKRVYSPIGLDIGSETPAEIAVAIMAEIINVHRGGRARSLADALQTDRRLPLHPQRVAGGN